MILEEVAGKSEALAALDAELEGIFEAYGHDDPETEAVVLRATVDGLIQYLLLEPERFRIEEAVERVLSLHGGRSGVGG